MCFHEWVTHADHLCVLVKSEENLKKIWDFSHKRFHEYTPFVYTRVFFQDWAYWAKLEFDMDFEARSEAIRVSFFRVKVKSLFSHVFHCVILYDWVWLNKVNDYMIRFGDFRVNSYEMWGMGFVCMVWCILEYVRVSMVLNMVLKIIIGKVIGQNLVD